MTDFDLDELQKLKERTLLRQRRKTNLVEHEAAIKKMMNMDISLPVILEWLIEKKKVETTLPALRRFVKKSFGETFYTDFAARNGWQKKRHQKFSPPVQMPRIPAKTAAPPKKGGVTQEELKTIARGTVDLSVYDEE